MNKSVTKEMTSGNPMQLIIEFAIPLLLGNLFQQVYSLVDTAIVGKTLGVDALAAVGSTGSVIFMVMGFTMGSMNGFALPVAQQFGARNYDKLKKYYGNAIILAVITALVMSGVTMLLCRSILRWMNTPSNIEELAYDYLMVIFAGIPVTVLYNFVSGMLRALGDSKRPLYFLLISSGLNIVLDLVFILVFHWGVAGAAIATVFSQLVSGILSVIYVARSVELLHVRRENLKISGECVAGLCVMGYPMGFQYGITAIGAVILQTAVNGLGSTCVAALTAAQKLDIFGECPFMALGSAIATYVGQNVGAKKFDRVKTGLYGTSMIGAVYSLIMLGLCALGGRYLFYLFVDATQTEVIRLGYQCIMTYLFFFIPLALVNIVRFTIQGMGYSALAICAGIVEMIARSIVAILFVPRYGFDAVCVAAPIAWVMADAFLIPAFFWCFARLKADTGDGDLRQF